MAVRYPYRLATAQGAASLNVTPPAGRGIVVTHIGVRTTQQEDFAQVTNGPTTVGYFSTGEHNRNHIPPRNINDQDTAGRRQEKRGILAEAEDLDLPAEFPVAEGDTFTVELSNSAELIEVEYREVDAGDIDPTQPNGRDSRRGLLVMYGTNAQAIGAGGYNVLRRSLLPAQLPQFPYEELVPAGSQVNLVAAAAIDNETTTTTGGDAWRTTALRLTKNREILFDPNRTGWVVRGDGASDGADEEIDGQGINQIPYPGDARVGDFRQLPEPQTFAEGDELTVEMGVEVDQGAGYNAEDDSIRVALIGQIQPAGGGNGQGSQ